MKRFAFTLVTGLAIMLLVAACDKDKDDPVSGSKSSTPWYQVDTCSGDSPYSTFGRWGDNTPAFRISLSFPQAWLKEPEYAASKWNICNEFTIMINRTQVQNGVGLDGINTICCGSIDGDALGRCYTWRDSQTGRIVEADIKLNSNYNLSVGGSEDSYDVRSILTHEFGHFCGLDHVDDRTHTMSPTMPKNSNIYRTLCEGDQRGIRALY